MNAITHYVSGDNDKAACGKPLALIHVHHNLISILSRDVNCAGCKKVFSDMEAMGFFPR